MNRISLIIMIVLCLAGPLSAGPVPAPPQGMVFVPAGEFVMGSDEKDLERVLKGTRGKIDWFKDETPRKKVSVKAFFIDAHEVTNAEYKKMKTDYAWPSGRDNHPVVNITWPDADAYCRAAGKRLPTEEEWEKAARGEDGQIYPWGNAFGKGLANTSESGLGGRAKVGQYRVEQSGEKQPAGTTEAGAFPGGKSLYGAHDMAGNAWEWTSSWYDKGKMMRVLKGGSWLAPALSARAAVRLGDAPGTVANDYGFRCAKDAP